MNLYKLVDGKPVPVENVLEWAEWMEENEEDCILGNFRHLREPIRVSTIFIGIDSGLYSIPMVFETAVFDDREGNDGVSIYRYETWDQAKAGHSQIVESIK